MNGTMIKTPGDFRDHLNQLTGFGYKEAPQGTPNRYPAWVTLDSLSWAFSFKYPIIGIYTLVPRSGKSEVGREFLRAGVTLLKMADTLKRMTEVFLDDLGIPAPHHYIEYDKETPLPGLTESITTRDLMSGLGHNWGRELLYQNLWIDIMRLKLDRIAGPIVIDDVRYPNEAEFIKNEGGTLIRVDRPGFEHPHSAYPGEGNLAEWTPDLILVNNGSLEKLRAEAARVCQFFIA